MIKSISSVIAWGLNCAKQWSGFGLSSTTRNISVKGKTKKLLPNKFTGPFQFVKQKCDNAFLVEDRPLSGRNEPCGASTRTLHRCGYSTSAPARRTLTSAQRTTVGLQRTSTQTRCRNTQLTCHPTMSSPPLRYRYIYPSGPCCPPTEPITWLFVSMICWRVHCLQ